MADTPNPPSEWISRKDERLRIVSDKLWAKVQARQKTQVHAVGDRVKRGMSKADAKRTGAGPKFLLSSLLQCAHCGSSYAIAGRDVYACSGHTGGGDSLCKNDALLHRTVAEAEVLAGIKKQLLSPAVVEEICRRVRAELRKPKGSIIDHHARIATLKAEVGNIVEAIATGILKASTTLAARLAAAEAEIEQLEGAKAANDAPAPVVLRHLAGLRGTAIKAVERLETTLASGDIIRARREIKDYIGMISVEANAREIRLFSKRGHVSAVLLRAVGTNTSLFGSGGRI